MAFSLYIYLSYHLAYSPLQSKNVLIDAKPDRIDAVKLCDFGISRTITESTLAETRIGELFCLVFLV
jgi:serine/threonine protein kinase